MRRLTVIFLLILAMSLEAWPEPGDGLRFVNYSAVDGLPSNAVYAIAQDADGFLWVGTRGGLCRYDGVQFHKEISDKRITSLTVDKENRIWVGTIDCLTVFAGHNRPSALHGKHVRALLTDSDGFVWAATRDGLLFKFGFDGGIKELACTNYVYRYFEGDYPYQQVYEDADGRIWLGGRIVNCQWIEDREHPATVVINEHGAIGSYASVNSTLYGFNDYENTLNRITPGSSEPVGHLPIYHASLLTDSKGRLWAAGSYGLGLVDPSKPEETICFKHLADDAASLASSELYCIFEDRQGNIWVGGDNGLSVLSQVLQPVQTLDLPSRQISALMQASDGRLWVGTADDGAYILSRDGKVERVDYRPAGKSNEGHVSCLYEDHSGAVYIGLYAGCGFNIWENGRVRRGFVSGPIPEAQHVVSDGNRITSNWITDFLEGRDGRFWVVTWEGVGLNEWDRKSGKTLPVEWLSPFFYPTPDNDSDTYLSSRLGSRLIEDAPGNLVYGTTEAGLNIIDRDTRLVTKYLSDPSDSLSLPDNYVTDLCLAPDGKLWVATRGGLWTPDKAGAGRVLLRGKLIQSVIADGKGRLWAGTEEGLYFVDTDGSIGVARKGLGFPSDVFSERAACRLSDGRLAFGSPAGAAVFHPDSLLAIQMSGNLLLAPLVQHRYRLDEGEWIYGRFAGLPDNITPGRYVLEEQKTDAFGRWEKGESAIREISVPLPLLLRWPFLILYLLLFLALAWIVVRLRERKVLIQELDTRNRFFSIISHDLRNPVSGNKILSRQLLEQVDALPREQLKEALGALSDSAEATSSLLENLLLWSLGEKGIMKPVMREENLAALAAEAAGGIHGGEIIQLDIPYGLTVRTDKNMLLTCLRNLLENAVKVSPEGGKVVLSARARRIIITDKGPGMKDSGKQWNHGLGLVITRELLDKMGASMEFRNRPEGGLEITISL